VESYLCEECLQGLPLASPGYENITLFEYNHQVVKKAIWNLKYKGHRDIAETLGTLLYHRLAEEAAERLLFHQERERKILVLPVPLAPKKRRARSFNQAELIARHLVAADPLNLELATDVLVKHKETPSQVSVNGRLRRLANIRGSFSVWKPEVAHRRNIIVVDDVITTGGTMTEARTVLRRAGAGLVLGAAIAQG